MNTFASVPLLTRIAPTPSGFLHLGNAFSFALAWLMARSQKGKVWLRIDDIDSGRFRRDYLEDILISLDWLGLDWDIGPVSLDDFLVCHSQHLRLELYHAAIRKLEESGATFSCACSRTRQAISPEGQHLCSVLHQPNTSEPQALKVKTQGVFQTVCDAKSGRMTIDLHREIPEFVLRNKNGLPSYQVVSLCDDVSRGVSLIVRGLDLIPSTAAQLYLAGLLGYKSFGMAKFVHHGLLTDSKGKKLSKSEGSPSLRYMRQNGRRVREIVSYFADWIGISEKPASFAALIGHPAFLA